MLDVAGHSSAPGVAVNTVPYKATDNQQWLLVPGTTQYVGMRNRNSGLMLDNRDGSLLDGAVILQWTGNGLAPQRWRLERAN